MQVDQTDLKLRKSHKSQKAITADLVQQLIRREHILKKSIDTCDILFVNKKMNTTTKQLCTQEVQKQSKIFNDYLDIYKKIDEKHQRPYKNMVKRLKQKVDEHQSLLQKVSQNKHQQFINSKKQIWQEQFQSQSSFKYILRGILGVIGAMLLHFLFGCIFRWAMINNYITSYYKITNDPYIQTGHNSIGTPIFMLSAGIMMKKGIKVCNYFQQKFRYGKIIFFVIIVCCVSLTILASSFMPSVIYFMFFHNFLFGFFVGFLFLTSLSECQKYFQSQKLLVTSIVLTGEGLGCVFFGLQNIYCFNPDLMPPNNSGFYTGYYDYVSYSVPYCILQMSAYALGIGLLGCLLMIPITQYNNDQVVIEYRIKTRKNFENQCYTEQQALKSRIFYIIGVIIIFASPGNFFMGINYKNIPKQKIHNQQFLAYVALSGMLANGFFRFVWGGLIQQIGFKWSFLIAMVLNSIGYFALPFSIQYYNWYLGAYTLIGAVTGGLMVLFTNLSLLVFGEVGNQIFGYMWGAFTIANFIQYFLGATVSKVIPHAYLVVLFGFTSIIALLISSCTKYQGRWQNSLNKLTY